MLFVKKTLLTFLWYLNKKNCKIIQVSHVTVTYRDGRVAQMENVYVRGSKVRFIILPDMLRNAPMFKSKMTMGGAAGRGKSGMIRSSGMLSLIF